MIVTSSMNAFRILGTCLDLPKGCVSFSLEGRVDDCLMLKTVSYVDGGKFNEFVAMVKTFDLVERPPEKPHSITGKPT